MTDFDADYAAERWREGSKYFFSYSPPTYTYRGPSFRPSVPRPAGHDDGSDFNFTGSPETQYHHRNITPETLKNIEKREDSVDDYYEEMRQRRDSGLEPIPWDEWLSRVAYVRNAMAWDEWAPKIKGGCKDGCGSRQLNIHGRYIIPEAGAFLNYSHRGGTGNPHLFVSDIYTHPENRKDGVAEALMRRLAEDHPGIPIDPGYMTPDGQKFHDRMLDKDPEARQLVTAMAWDEWAPKIERHGESAKKIFGEDWPGSTHTYIIRHPEIIHDEDHRPGYFNRHWSDDVGAYSALAYAHNPKDKALAVRMIHTHPRHRKDGVAEALMRKLVEDHPDHIIDPGTMTDMGQAFKNRMVEKEPEAHKVLDEPPPGYTDNPPNQIYMDWEQSPLRRRRANSLLVGPEDAYDEWDWFTRHQEHPASSVTTDAETWYHVSPHRILEGTTLAPMRGETPWNDNPYQNGLGNRANWIWVEFDKDKARAWMRYILEHQPEAFIYRVQPDVGPFAWNGTADEGWVTNRAEVLELLDQTSHDLSFQEKA